MWRRKLTDRLLTALEDTPIVFLQGARQVGKSTLVQSIANEQHPALYLTFDSITMLGAAQQDPVGFLASFGKQNIILDEIQRTPELFLPLKEEVDRQRRAGRFLLTGSANALVLPRLADILVGRMEVMTLWPLAQSEIEESESDFIDITFSDATVPIQRIVCSRENVIARALRGGYPEALSRNTEVRRSDWFKSYITTLLQRDVRDLAQIHGLSDLSLLLSLVAARATSLLNLSDLTRSANIPATTLSRYLTLLEATFVLQQVPAWSSNLSSRLTKAPKLLFGDTGVLTALTGMTEASIATLPTQAGVVVENFVGMELMKLLSWSQERAQLFHLRTQDRKEVDFLLQNRAGKVVGIEVKSASSVQESDFKGLRILAEMVGDQFARGCVFYTGDMVIPFGPKMIALPIAVLWNKLQ